MYQKQTCNVGNGTARVKSTNAVKPIKGTLMQIWKISLHIRIHLKIIPSKFRILNPNKSRVVYPRSLSFS